MALNATIYKVELQVSDIDRHYYQAHSLVVAQHPSETTERMLVRILAFALNASDSLEFTKGLSTESEPSLWQKTLTGEVNLWVEVGQPSYKRIKKACSQSNQVKVYTYSGHSAEVWRQQNKNDFAKLNKLQLIDIPQNSVQSLESAMSRNMALQCTIQEGLIWFSSEQSSCEITPTSYSF